MNIRPSVLLATLAASTALACAQTLDEIIDITGTVRGIKTLSASVDSAPVTSVTEDLWTPEGLISGFGEAGTTLNVGTLRLSATPPDDDMVFIERPGGGGNKPQWVAEVRGGYRYGVSGPAVAGSTPDVTVNMSTVTEFDVTFVVRDFIAADLRLYEEMNLSYFLGGFIFDPLELAWDFGREPLVMTGPRGQEFVGDVTGVTLVPGEYHVDELAGEFLFVTGTGASASDWAGSGAQIVARIGFGRTVPLDEYDLDDDNDFDLDDLRLWRENSASGMPVYDTLGDGVIDDNDRAELVRALSFLLDTPLLDCDGNLKHDPFEIEFDGVTPRCVLTSCAADFNADQRVDIVDFGVFGSAFNTMVGDPNYNADADFNDDGMVDIVDFGVFGSEFNNGPTQCEA